MLNKYRQVLMEMTVMRKRFAKTGIDGGDDASMLNKYQQVLMEMMVVRKRFAKLASTEETMVQC
jgi:hypothetical protein